MIPILRRRAVIEVVTTHGEITESAIKRMLEDLLKDVRPETLRRYGVLPSSLKVKQYSRVVAAEFGRIPEPDEEEV